MTKVADLLLHPIGKKWAGSQPSFSQLRPSGDSPPLVGRDGGGEVGEEGEDPLQQCNRLQGRAVPGVADAELPWHLPWFSLQLIDEVVDDLLSPGIQVESAEWGKEWWLMKEKTWR